jgi:hypothetical protein
MLVKKIGKKVLKHIGIQPAAISQKLACWSVLLAQREQGLSKLVRFLREIVPDISNQESREVLNSSAYWELKRRTLQAFQCSLMMRAIEDIPKQKLVVADIGDSSGTHMLYLKELTKGHRDNIDTVSINLDPRAIEKIRARGLKAILKRAEDIAPEDVGGNQIELCTSFQMIEHLHNPAIFFRRLAKNRLCKNMLITVPYLRKSRVGLHHLRSRSSEIVYAEDVHIFELSPEDWSLLLLHSGWKLVFSKIYYQYPRNIPIVNTLLRIYWKMFDFEGFWGAVLERDDSWSKLYQDWED